MKKITDMLKLNFKNNTLESNNGDSDKLTTGLAKFRSVIERVSDAFVALDENWCYTYMNKRAGEIFGRDPEAMVGKHIWTEFPEGIDQPFYKAYYKAMAEQKYIQLEAYYPPYDRWFINHIYPSRDGLTIYFNDITERKKTEDQLRISEGRLRKAQEMGQLGYWELERNSTMIWGSEKALEIFGFPPDVGEVSIKEIEACIPDMNKVRQAALGLIKNNSKYDIELIIHPADGSPMKYILASGEIECDNQGKRSKIMGVLQDITTRKIAEQKLVDATREIGDILKSVTDGFFAVDKKWKVKYWSQSAERVMGVDPDQVVDKNFWEVFANVIPSMSTHEFMRAMEETISVHFEEYFPHVDTWFRFNVYPSKEGLSISFQDITENRRNALLNNLEKETLDLYTKNYSLEDILTFLLNGIQRIHPEMICSVLKIKDGHMYNWSSPQLPEGYNEEVEGLPIGIGHGSCGTAAYLREKVEAKDISTNPFWKEYKHIAAKFGLKSCWSYPIFDSHTNLLGTFGIYYTKIRSPKKAEELTIERVRVILINIIENKLAENALKTYKDQLELIYNTTNDIIFLISIEEGNRYRFTTVNHAFLSAMGLKKEQVEGNYVDKVIPEASHALVFSNYKRAIQEGHTVYWEETTDYPRGKKTGIVSISPVFNKRGECTNLMGTVHDITERKKTEEEIKRSNQELQNKIEELKEKNLRLEDIAWIQSHKVRAPLARIMGLIDLLQNYSSAEMNKDEMLGYIMSSAHELDGLIFEIVKRTEEKF